MDYSIGRLGDPWTMCLNLQVSSSHSCYLGAYPLCHYLTNQSDYKCIESHPCRLGFFDEAIQLESDCLQIEAAINTLACLVLLRIA